MDVIICGCTLENRCKKTTQLTERKKSRKSEAFSVSNCDFMTSSPGRSIPVRVWNNACAVSTRVLAWCLFLCNLYRTLDTILQNGTRQLRWGTQPTCNVSNLQQPANASLNIPKLIANFNLEILEVELQEPTWNPANRLPLKLMEPERLRSVESHRYCAQHNTLNLPPS